MNEYYHRFKKWTAEFHEPVIWSETSTEADTAPLAICLAALKAVGYHFDRKDPNP